jgi:hypothetical protein
LQIGIAPKNPIGLTFSTQTTQDDGDVVPNQDDNNQ